MLTTEQYREVKERILAHDAWVDTIRDKRTGWASYKPEDKPAHIPDVSNEERSAVEVYEFCNEPPERYMVYVNEKTGEATTWTGEKLGQCKLGNSFRDNFGGLRVPVRIQAINGFSYAGTFYKSAGDYARVKRVK